MKKNKNKSKIQNKIQTAECAGGGEGFKGAESKDSL
jgi:hypothetical protein